MVGPAVVDWAEEEAGPDAVDWAEEAAGPDAVDAINTVSNESI